MNMDEGQEGKKVHDLTRDAILSDRHPLQARLGIRSIGEGSFNNTHRRDRDRHNVRAFTHHTLLLTSSLKI